MKFARRGLLALPAILGACSPSGMLNAAAPEEGFSVATDLAYGPHARHRLDVYRPDDAVDAPTVLFLYGGAWQRGRRQTYRFLGASLASAGVVCVVADYRVWPEVGFPAFLHDSARATAWTKAHIAEHGGDPKRLFAMGHSAGAYNVAMLALDPSYLGEVGMEAKRDLRGVIGLSGPYDFLPLHMEVLKEIFGPEDRLPRTQPINFVTDRAPPMFLASGGSDTTVLPANTERLAAKLADHGNDVETAIYPSVGHAPLIGAFSGLLRFVAPVRTDVLRFIESRVA